MGFNSAFKGLKLLNEDQCTFFIISRSVLFRMRIFLGKTFREIEIRRFVFNMFFFVVENRAIYVEKYCRAGQATDDNVAHVQCMLDT